MSGAARKRRAEAVIADLIFRASPRMDARAIAKRMAERHFSLAPALEAHEVDLMRVDGLNPHTAQLFSMLPQLARYVRTEAALDRGRNLAGFRDCGAYFAARCVGLHHERMLLLCLGADGVLRQSAAVSDGTLDETPFYMRQLIERALHCGARYLVLCHNHPTGVAFASMNDVKATRALLGACGPLGLVLLDHIIIADGLAVSMRQDTMGDREFLAQAPDDPVLIRWFQA